MTSFNGLPLSRFVSAACPAPLAPSPRRREPNRWGPIVAQPRQQTAAPRGRLFPRSIWVRSSAPRTGAAARPRARPRAVAGRPRAVCRAGASSRARPRARLRLRSRPIAGARAPARARAATPGAGRRPLVARDLGTGDCLRQLRDEALEVLRHALLVAADGACHLRRVAVADGLGQGLDRRVGRDLLGLLGVLSLRVLQLLLLDTGAAQGVNGPLGSGHRLADRGADDRRLSAERLHAPLELAGVVLRLLEMLLQALLVGVALGHLDVRGERGLQFLFLAVRLIEVLQELHAAFVCFRHWCSISLLGGHQSATPGDGPQPGGSERRRYRLTRKWAIPLDWYPGT